MSASACFHGPYAYQPEFHAPGTVEHHPDGYSSFGISDGKGSDITLFFDTRDALEELVKAATEALGQWEPRAAAVTCPICGAALEPSGVCKVCTAVPIGEYPVSELACGDTVQAAEAIAPGTPVYCQAHGDTHVIAADEAQQ